jgi:hypothetical protein
MNLLRDPISLLRSSPYLCTAAVLEPTSGRSRRFLPPFFTPIYQPESLAPSKAMP